MGCGFGEWAVPRVSKIPKKEGTCTNPLGSYIPFVKVHVLEVCRWWVRGYGLEIQTGHCISGVVLSLLSPFRRN